MGANESMEEQAGVVVDDKDVPMVPPVAPISTIDATEFNPLTVVATSKALKGLFTKMRDVRTSSADFVKYSNRAMTILAEEAMARVSITKCHYSNALRPLRGCRNS
jgi:hypothetical protein